MDRVSFIDSESGTDLIIAFAVIDEHDTYHVESLTIIRTPKYELLLEEGERGASVSFRHEEDGDGRRRLLEVSHNADSGMICLACEGKNYELDISDVEKDEIERMNRLFKEMNFDSSIKMSGL